MPLHFHDTFSSAGSLSGATPDTLGTTWGYQMIRQSDTFGTYDYYMGGSGSNTALTKSSGTAQHTGTAARAAGYASSYKATWGTNCPNNFDMEFKVASLPSTGYRLWVLFRCPNFTDYSGPQKHELWSGFCLNGSSTYYQVVNNTDGAINITEHTKAVNDIVKLVVNGSSVRVDVNGVTGTNRTYSNMQSSGHVFLATSGISAAQGFDTLTGGTLDYIKIADPGDLNYTGSLPKNLILGGGLI